MLQLLFIVCLPFSCYVFTGSSIRSLSHQVFGNDYPTVDGTCVRDYLHVLDLAGGHVLALQALQEGSTLNEKVFASVQEGKGKFKAYNLGKGKGMSVLQIVEAMRKATGFEYKTEVVGRR